MAVDPQIQALIDQMRAEGVKPLEALTVPEARLAARDLIGLQGQPEPVARVAHRFIPGPTADLPARIYYPAGDGPFPALIYLHGGGWVICNNEICDPTTRSLANGSGCVVVAVNYQKAPEHKFPIPVEDAWAATVWVAGNAAELNIDPARIGVAGDSAGGNLAAVTAIRARDEGGPALSCQVLVYPATDANFDKPSYLANAAGYLLRRATMQWCYSHYLNDPAEGDDPRVSPLRAADLSGLPPVLVVTAEYDPLLDDGRLYAEKLRAAGTPVTYSEYPGTTHMFYYLQGIADCAKQLHQEIGTWVRQVHK